MRRIYLLLVILLVIITSCKQVDFTAPTGATLTIIANPTIVSLNGGTSEITVMGQRASGAPLTDGTVIYFTTNIGRVEPNKVETSGGFAKTTFISDDRSGEAEIKASSGAAEPVSVTIKVGTIVLSTIELQANPPNLPKGGGKTEISARLLDETGKGMANVPVIFSTTAGQLESKGKIIYSNSNGIAKDKLTTEVTAQVWVTAGTVTSSQLTIYVGEEGMGSPPVASFIISPTTTLSSGQKAYFDASASVDPDGRIVRYDWNFGDGKSGSGVKVQHIYYNTTNTSVTYQVQLKVTDNLGLYDTAQATVSVSPLSCPLYVNLSYYENDSTDNDNIPEVNEFITFVANAPVGPCNSTCPNTTPEPNNPCCITNYDFKFGNDPVSPSACPEIKRSFSTSGTVTVQITVRNKQNDTASNSAEFPIYPQTITLTGNQNNSTNQ